MHALFAWLLVIQMVCDYFSPLHLVLPTFGISNTQWTPSVVSLWFVTPHLQLNTVFQLFDPNYIPATLCCLKYNLITTLTIIEMPCAAIELMTDFLSLMSTHATLGGYRRCGGKTGCFCCGKLMWQAHFQEYRTRFTVFKAALAQSCRM